MAKTISFNNTYQRIEASGGTVSDPVTLKDIYDYFVANPLALNYECPQRYGSSPYELCENNASEWSGLNGLGNPANESTDKTKGSYSIKASYSSPQSAYAGTSIYISSNYYVMVNIASANTKFAVGDEVVISNTTDWNGMIFKITSVSSTYIMGNLPTGFISKPTNSNPTITKYHQLSWNKNFSAGSFNMSFCDKVKFSVKTTGASVKLKGVILRPYYGRQTAGSGTEANCGYGGYIPLDITLSSTWQDLEYNIRDLIFHDGHSNVDARDYWLYMDRVTFLFDGLQSGEDVLVDGLRFVASNRNPQKIGENAYIFPVGLYVTNYFKDWGFYLQMNMLECGAANELGSVVYDGLYFNCQADGAGILGDYNAELYDQEGGVVMINHFGQASTQGISLFNTNCYGVTFIAPKNTLSVGGFNMNANSKLKSCTLINMGDVSSGQLTDTKMIGGRYGTVGGSVINSYQCVGQTYYAVWARPAAANNSYANAQVYKNIKVVHSQSGKTILYNYDYGYTAHRYIRMINFDISETNNPNYVKADNYTAYTNITRFAFSVDMKVNDSSGNAISGATVEFFDKDGNALQSYTTDANGLVTGQFCDFRETSADSGSGQTLYFDTEAHWTNYYPITIKISKAGYETYTGSLLKTYSKTDELLKTGLKQTISLKTAKKLKTLLPDGDQVAKLLNPEKGTDSNFCLVD